MPDLIPPHGGLSEPLNLTVSADDAATFKAEAAKLPKVPVSALVKHVDHIAKTAGVDSVGLGSDFDGISGMTPTGMEDVSHYGAIVKGLMDLGYSDGHIRKMMGLNLLRVLRANEEGAEKR